MATTHSISIDPASEFSVKLQQLTTSIDVLAIAFDTEEVPAASMAIFLNNLSDQSRALQDLYSQLMKPVAHKEVQP